MYIKIIILYYIELYIILYHIMLYCNIVKAY